jgi:50S ribosomal protein L16 3-hydroxylase
MIAQSFMHIGRSTPLLGGLSAREFMRRHWQKKPLLIRAAKPPDVPIVKRAELFALAADDAVESRLIERDGDRWSLRHGPFARRSLPGLQVPRWTLLVQGADLHLEAAHRLLGDFRFVPSARLDDVMFSYATDGGGVGPHIDSYDVFLLQVQGRRRWRIGRSKRTRLRTDTPLKILADFVPTDEWLLEPGDMLYLPPGWGHDGVADGETITASIGFRSAGRDSLGVEVLQQMLDAVRHDDDEPRYADPDQPATQRPARIPAALRRYADASVRRLVDDRGARAVALGQALSEPKPGVWFDAADDAERSDSAGVAVRLDRRSRMLYDERHVYINGETCRMDRRDAKMLQRLADRGRIDGSERAALGGEGRAAIDRWLAAGWLRHDTTET